MDAMPEGGELLISSSVTMNEEENREVATFQFKDTGQGIPGDVLIHVFEPFYTTKHDGVGLGLAVCKSIIEQHGGSISILSDKQKDVPTGTLIILTIPTNANNNL
jgi:signal transduction histidine kinase